jgi:hypothetical protein
VTGLKKARIVWTVTFLGITLAAIVMECVAGLLHPAGTIPWTEYLARYVPWPVQLIAYVALAVWLPFHFWRHDHMRKIAYDRGMAATNRPMVTARALQQATSQQLLDELAVRIVRRSDFSASPPSPVGGLLRALGVIGPDQDARIDDEGERTC